MIEYHDATVRVRYAETDQMGVVYHANYLIWFEVGRVELMRALGVEYKRMEIEDDCRIVVADAHCRYHHAAVYDEVLRIRTRIAESRNRVVKFSYEVIRDADGKVLANGETTHVICGSNGRPKLLPKKIPQCVQCHRRARARPERRMNVALSGNDLTFSQLYDVALRGETVLLSSAAIAGMNASRAVVERLVASGATAYGINTGFGKLASVRISAEQVRQLQVNLVRSHACGVGVPLSEEETRAMMLLRANAIAKGLSGVRPRIVETLCQMLNHRVHPVIPSQGSVGASGDLAPLAHLAQVVIGEGRANFRGETLPGGEAMKRAGITAVALEAKEGLSLLNGTQGMLALLSLALHEADILVDSADVAASLSLDALRGSPGHLTRASCRRARMKGPQRQHVTLRT